MGENCQAFETLVIYCSTLGPRFAPYLAQTWRYLCHVCDFISMKVLRRRAPCESLFSLTILISCLDIVGYSPCSSHVEKRAELLQIKWSLPRFFNLSTVSAPNVTRPFSHHCI